MPSPKTIAAVFERFQARGILSPEPWRTGSQEARDRAMALSVATYADDLAGLSDEQFIAAAKAYALSGERFWPTPGQLLALVPVDPSAELMRSGDLAWGHILAGLGTKWGIYRWPWRQPGPPEDGRVRLHADPDADAALWAGIDAVGGWAAFCAGSPSDAANRAAFRSAYEATIAALKPAHTGRLALAAANRPALPDGGGR